MLDGYSTSVLYIYVPARPSNADRNVTSRMDSPFYYFFIREKRIHERHKFISDTIKVRGSGHFQIHFFTCLVMQIVNINPHSKRVFNFSFFSPIYHGRIKHTKPYSVICNTMHENEFTI